MRKVTCKDINPSSSCDFEATGQTAKEVVGKMMAHIKSEHMGDVAGMGDGQIRTMIEDRVHE